MTRMPKAGEWWQHNGGYGICAFDHPPPRFYIDDVIQKDNIWETWIIYSNNDGCDYFVMTWDECESEWSLADKQYGRFDPIHGEYRMEQD